VYDNGNCYGVAPPVPPPGPIVRTSNIPAIDDDWAVGGPPATGLSDHYMIEYRGYLWPPKAATYHFCAYTDDGHKFWIDGTLVGDNWTDRFAHCGATYQYTFDGSAKTFLMWYYENTASATTRFRYSPIDDGDPNSWDKVPETWFSSLVQPATPSPPTGLTLEPKDGEVRLVWGLPASSGSGAISDYSIYYASVPGGPYSLFADGVSIVKDTTITGLTNGTTYYFKVAAKNPDGYGDLSAVTSGVAPVSYVAAPGALTLTGSTATTLTFTWTNTAHIGDNYRMFWSTNPTAEGGSYTGTGGTTYTVTGLTPSTTYYFKLAGWKNGVAGDVLQYRTSDFSVVVSGTTM
jgi:hypothetical protein